MAGKNFEILVSAKLDKNAKTTIQNELNNISKGIELNIKADSKSVNSLKQSIKGLGEKADDTKRKAQGLDDIISKFSRWQIVGDIIHGVKNAFGDMVDQVFELDASLVEFNKVTDLSQEQLEEFTDQAYNTAENIARTGKEVIDLSTEFSKAGYKDQALQLAEIGGLYQNIADGTVSTSDASALLVSQMKAFNVEAEDAITIIDQINEVSNNFAISSSDLAKAIPKVSATMAQAGNTMSETTALITAGTEIMTGQSSRVARGLRSISLNLRALDDEGNQNLELMAQMEGDFNKLGITLMGADGQLKSTFDILKELSEVYPTLDQNTQSYYAALIGGKTQVDVVNSVLSNFQTAIDANAAAMNSAGSAAKENEVYMNSLAGKLNNLKSSWQAFARETISSDLVKGFLDLANGMIKFISAIGGLKTILPAAIGLLIGFKGALMFNAAVLGITAAITGIKSAIIGVTGIIPNAVVAWKTYSAGIVSANTAIQASIPVIGLAITAISALTAVVTAGASKRKKAREEEEQQEEEARRERQRRAKERYDQAIEEVNNNNTVISSLQDIKKEYEDINSTELSAEERKERLAELQTRLNQTYKDNNLDLYNSSLEDTINKLDELQTLEKAESGKKLRDEYDRATRVLNDYNGALESAERTLKDFNETNRLGLDNMSETEKQRISDAQQAIKTSTGDFLADYNNLKNQIVEKEKEISTALSEGRTTDAENLRKEKDALLENKEAMDKNGEELFKYIETLRESADSVDYLTEEQQKLLEAYDDSEAVLAEWQEALIKIQEEEDRLNGVIDENIDKLISYSDNVDLLNQTQEMLNETGTITAEMYKKLSDNDLLQYLELVDGKLSVNTDSLDENSNAFKANAEQAVKDSLAQELLEIAIADQNGTLDDYLGTLGSATSVSSSVDTTNAVNRILEIGSAAASSTSLLGTLYSTLKNGEAAGGVVESGYTPSAKAQSVMEGAISRAQTKISAINAISLGGGSTKSSKGKSSGGSKSSSSSYTATVNTFYAYENAVDNAKAAVDRLNKALKNTKNLNEQEKITRQLIDATNTQIQKTKELRNAQVNQINDYINKLRQQGFQISYNSNINELNIQNMQHLADLTGDNAKEVEKLIKEIQSLNKDNRSLDSTISDLTNDISEYYDKLADFPEEKLKKFNELMKEFQQSQLSQLEDEIEDINYAMKHDERIIALEKQIEALENQNELLDNQKEIEEKLLAVEQAKDRLAKAREQKTLQVYREGQGFVWEADFDEIQQAEEELKNAQDALNEKVKDDQIEQLKAEKEALEQSYQDRIDALEDFLDDQNYLIDKANREGIETFDELRKALAEFGLDSAEYLSQATNWLNEYNSALSKLNTTTNETLSKAADGVIYSSAADNRIAQALAGISPDISSGKGVSLNNVSYGVNNGAGGNTIINIDNIELPNVQNAQDFVEALKKLPGMAISSSTSRT